MIVVVGWQPELLKDRSNVRLDRFRAQVKSLADRLIRPSTSHGREDVAFPWGEGVEGRLPAAAVDQSPDDLGIQDRLAVRNPGDGVDELGWIGDPILEEIADPPSTSSSRATAYSVSM